MTSSQSNSVHSTQTFDWWAERADDPQWQPDGSFKTLCPCHDDTDPSLHISEADDGRALVWDFGMQCRYGAIWTAFQEREARPLEVRVVAPSIEATEIPDLDESAVGENLEGEGESSEVKPVKQRHAVEYGLSRLSRVENWWQERTGVPWSETESLGATAGEMSVTFRSKGSKRAKVRHLDPTEGKKGISWVGRGAEAKLWPALDPQLPETIILTEGESDCVVCRHLRFDAFTFTLKRSLFEADVTDLYNRGVRQVIILFDADVAGRKDAQTLKAEVDSYDIDISAVNVDISMALKPLTGEKDICDLWLRMRTANGVKSPEAMARSAIDLCIDWELTEVPAQRRSRLDTEMQPGDQFILKEIDRRGWFVEDVLLYDSVGEIIGNGKIAKSFLLADLAISIASGHPFLNHFPIAEPATAVYITHEDTEAAFQDRKIKIANKYGLLDGLYYKVHDKVLEYDKLVGTPPDWMKRLRIVTSRRFRFSRNPQYLENLLFDLDEVAKRSGDIRFIGFDPLFRMLDDSWDMFKAQDLAEVVFDQMDRIRSEFGASCLLAHHRNYEGRNYGSVGHEIFTENTLDIKGTARDFAKGKWMGVTTIFKSAATEGFAYRNIGDLKYVYDFEVIDGTAPKSASAPDAFDMTLDFIKSNPYCTREFIVQETDLSKWAVGEAVRELLDTRPVILEEVDRPEDYLTDDEKARPPGGRIAKGLRARDLVVKVDGETDD